MQPRPGKRTAAAVIGRIAAFLCVLLVSWAAVAEDVDDPNRPPDSYVAPSKTQLFQPCYMRCLEDKHYADVCAGVCDAGDSTNPAKFTKHTYECYTGCVNDPGKGALWCMGNCLGWARTLEMQDTQLPPEKGITIQGTSPSGP